MAQARYGWESHLSPNAHPGQGVIVGRSVGVGEQATLRLPPVSDVLSSASPLFLVGHEPFCNDSRSEMNMRTRRKRLLFNEAPNGKKVWKDHLRAPDVLAWRLV